jgi:hypothetical protein
MGDDALYDTIFQLFPTKESQQLELWQCDVDVVSRWVFDSLLEVCETHEADAAAKFYRGLSKVSYKASLHWLQDRLFERQVLNYTPNPGRHLEDT